MAEIPEPTPRTITAIDTWHEQNREAPRTHLGASILGHKCARYIWLLFRWAVPDNFSGRMLRLFKRGQLEEQVFVENLRAIGVNIHHTSHPFANDGGQLFLNLGCHVGGSVDGIIESGLPEAPKTRHIAEFKTHNEKSFKELQAKGVYEAKNQHWCQMQLYMLGTGIDRAFYMAVNKNTDELYTERVEFNENAAKILLNRGHKIALTDNMPKPMANASPNWWECQMCPACDFCWHSHWSKEINCRTCAHVTATPKGSWTCNFDQGRDISPSIARNGCNAHVMHPDLVPWPYAGGTPDGLRAYYSIDERRILNGLEGSDPDNPLDAKATEANEALSTRHIFEGFRSRAQLAQAFEQN